MGNQKQRHVVHDARNVLVKTEPKAMKIGRQVTFPQQPAPVAYGGEDDDYEEEYYQPRPIVARAPYTPQATSSAALQQILENTNYIADRIAPSPAMALLATVPLVLIGASLIVVWIQPTIGNIVHPLLIVACGFFLWLIWKEYRKSGE